jgi:16S rRNA (cytosine1402-N4)-methyltransferase
LDPKQGGVYVDATLGAGGHTRLICERIGAQGTLIGIDEDEDALIRAKAATEGLGTNMHLIRGNFRNVAQIVHDLGYEHINGIMFDLGLSTPQLETSGRGFSFQRDEPLLMTFGKEGSALITAEVIVNEWSLETLTDILRGFGEERFAKRIASAIVAARETRRITRTSELVEIISHAVPAWYCHRKIHFATKTFQALRIAANDEMNALPEGLAGALELLAPGGIMAVISFHSLEDRFVKHFFKQKAQEGAGTLLTKKPIVPDKEELTHNRKARSAKLRALQKVL